MKWFNRLFILLILLFVIISCSEPILLRLFAPFMRARAKPPVELRTPKVLVGSTYLSKSLFWQDEQLGSITDIVYEKSGPTPGVKIRIAGEKGALFLDKNKNMESKFIFNQKAAHVDIIDVENDGKCEFLNRGGYGWQPASLMKNNGENAWVYEWRLPGQSIPVGINDMCAGDVDGDGIKEFIVGLNGSGGLHLLDRNGQIKWRQPDTGVHHVEMVDINRDGRPEIMHSNSSGEIVVRDGQGRIIRNIKPPFYSPDFSLCNWPGQKDREYILLYRQDKVYLLDFNGGIAAQFNAPKSNFTGVARGVPVRLRDDEPEYLGVIVEFHPKWKRSGLYVFDPAGVLVYQEILAETCPSMAAVPLDSTGTEVLLVGGEGRIWQYKFLNAYSRILTKGP